MRNEVNVRMMQYIFNVLLALAIFISGAGTKGAQGGHWPPQYLADQLTLLQPGRKDYPHLLPLAPPMFLISPSGITVINNIDLVEKELTNLFTTT